MPKYIIEREIPGAGDFTGDGIADLMVRDDSGKLYLYEWLGDRWGLIN